MNYPTHDADLSEAFDAWQRSDQDEVSLSKSLTLQRSWDEPSTEVLLEVTYQFARSAGRTRLSAILDGVELRLDQPLRLLPCYIKKPWGQEIWFSGIEARGESRVAGSGGDIPLSHCLALAPDLLSDRKPVVLLKVLDPDAEPVRGELYLEVHEEKREVYVVTHVDRSAWPGGTGAIRFGVNQQLRQEYASDAEFRVAFTAAVERYWEIRNAIDSGRRSAPELTSEEFQARSAMERFTTLAPLEVGDVVTVPTWVPHSLQHGVRVVEFQTPVYERFIISFPQQVVTQDGWDSAEAISRMSLERPPPASFEVLAHGVERIARFADFNVCRINLDAGASYTFPDHLPYALAIAVGKPVKAGELHLEAGEACFVPRLAIRSAAGGARLENPGGEPALCLVAAPGI